MIKLSTVSATPSPFHRGEAEIQERMGVRARIDEFARQVVRDHMPQQHRTFYEQLPFAVVAARDAQERPWVTLLAKTGLESTPGLLESPDPQSLVVHGHPVVGDALAGALHEGADVGMLGIELHSRRRNRLNGRVAETDNQGWRMAVGQSFGNCPQFIRSRHWSSAPAPAVPVRIGGATLSFDQQSWIASADTFFVASGFREGGDSAAFGMDASHRGGAPGFVHIENSNTLVWPDYAGNHHYNTLGNLLLDQRIGMLFVDFSSGSLLQITGSAELLWSAEELVRFPDAQRAVRVRITEVNELRAAVPIRWVAEPELRLQVDKIVDETDEVRSIWFRTADQNQLPRAQAGMHLPLQIEVGGRTHYRSYSLSAIEDAGVDSRWRISVAKVPGGRVSSAIHDALQEGDQITAGMPKGDFVLAASDRPVMLIGAGIGVTPLLPLAKDAIRAGRPVTFLRSVRHTRIDALGGEIDQLQDSHDATVHRHISRTESGNRRLHARDIVGWLPGTDVDVYACGPAGFVQAVTSAVREAGVPVAQFYSESFG